MRAALACGLPREPAKNPPDAPRRQLRDPALPRAQRHDDRDRRALARLPPGVPAAAAPELAHDGVGAEEPVVRRGAAARAAPARRGLAMKRSDGRILTTHTGSL